MVRFLVVVRARFLGASSEEDEDDDDEDDDSLDDTEELADADSSFLRGMAVGSELHGEKNVRTKKFCFIFFFIKIV